MVQSPNYTGENAGAGMVRGGGTKATESLQELNRTILEAEKFKYSERKKEEADFLEAIKTKPEFVISAKARERQAQALQQFNNKFAPLIKKGYLTIEEKTAMANDRAALEAMQQEQLAQYKQYLGMKEAMLKDTQGRFDREEFRQWEEDYQQTGQFDHATMPLQGVDPYLYFQKNPVIGTEELNEATGIRSSGTVDESMAHIAAHVQTNEPLRIGLIKKFQALPIDKKLKYLDTDNSGTVSPQEAQAAQGVNPNQPDNPILRYAYDEYKDVAIRKDALKKAKGTSTTPKETTVTPSKVGGSWVKMSSGIQTPSLPKKYSDREYSQTQSFQFGGNTVIYGIRSSGARVLNGTWSAEDASAGSVDGVIRLYDPTKKVFVIQVSRTSESTDAKTSTLLEIPEDNVLEYENIPIEYVGMPMTIGDYKKNYMSAGGTIPTPISTSSEIGSLNDL